MSSQKVAEIHAELRLRDATLAVAESLTGGQLCAALTEPAGASQVFRGGLVVYASDLKVSLAGVDSALLKQRGAVDPEVARRLAMGARERLGATYGLGLTGVAGPDEQDHHPVGEVHVSLAGPNSLTVVESLSLDTELPAPTSQRQVIREAAVTAAIDLVWAALRESTGRT